ncbi:MAG: hypothetical protein GJ680_10365 [Alteromonadaceae bacterium]|nr:hypothetical protein [Alteromonadaceae bacterium]
MNKFANEIAQIYVFSRSKIAICFLSLLFSLSTIPVLAQADSKPVPQKDAQKILKQTDDKAQSAVPKLKAKSEDNTQVEHSSAETVNAEDSKNTGIDWGDWNLKPSSQFGVGIQGNIEAEINLLDKSSLIENATGVATKNTPANLANKTKSKDLKKMMAELEAMEAKVKKEIEDDTEF